LEQKETIKMFVHKSFIPIGRGFKPLPMGMRIQQTTIAIDLIKTTV
jgi:hypothetical protein